MTGRDRGLDAEEIKRILNLEPLADEGGWWSQVWYDRHSSAIYYLLTPQDFSALHRLPGPEVYHHYLGDPVELITMHPDEGVRHRILGPDLAAGHRPAAVVEEGRLAGKPHDRGMEPGRDDNGSEIRGRPASSSAIAFG